MVFKPFTTLARQSISKHIVTHAQAGVAATQSSFASATLPIRAPRADLPARVYNSFGSSNSGRAAPGKDGQGSDGLSSFYAAHNQDGPDSDRDSKRYLFSKKLLWSKAQHQAQQKQLLATPEPIFEDPRLTNSRSNSFLSEVEGETTEKAVEEALKDDAEAIAEASNEAAVEEVDAASAEVEATPPTPASAHEDASVPAEDVVPESQSISAEPTNTASETPVATSQYNNQLQSLRNEGRFQEVAALFQHMVQEGIPPNTITYNHLLTAISNLRPHAVSDVVDIYSEMLRRQLIPTTATYSILIQFLSARALHSWHVAHHLETEASRFNVAIPSRTSEAEDMKKEGCMNLAMDLFYLSTEVRTERVFPDSIYRVLLKACARYGRQEDMVKVFEHMEDHQVEADLDIVRFLIRGFGRSGNVKSAIETYHTYHDKVVAESTGNLDEHYEVYRDLLKAYMDAGDAEGAVSFAEKIVANNQTPARLETLKETMVLGFIEQKDFDAARTWWGKIDLDPSRMQWLAATAVRVADLGDIHFASQIYAAMRTFKLHGGSRHAIARAQMAILASCINHGLVPEAQEIWGDLQFRELSAGPSISAAVSFTMLLFQNNHNNEALVVLSQFGEFYLADYLPDPQTEPSNEWPGDKKVEQLREMYDFMITSLSGQGLLDPSIALDITSLSLSRCGNVGTAAARKVLGFFTDDEPRLLGLTAPQLAMVLDLQTTIMQRAKDKGLDIAHDAAAFQAMCSIAVDASHPPTPTLVKSVERGFSLQAPAEELLGRWMAHLNSPSPVVSVPGTPFLTHPSPTFPPTPQASPTLVASDLGSDDAFDPYWEITDIRNSDIIEHSIDRSKLRFPDLRRIYRGTRKTGLSIRLTTLAKLVGFAARGPADMHTDFFEEIYRNAKLDMPYMPEHHVSRAGWCLLLDSLLAASLGANNHVKAGMYHEELRKLGAAPSANTYGLYIVSLKSSHQTYDEASEALKIFQQAKAEGVAASSFLYNALIGKLAKARRVDDCLFYFAEMRAVGIRPTSVTYGTMINALTRVGDETFAEELFTEMEAMPNYKPRPAPYNSLMQFFISTKRDRSKVLSYYTRMLTLGISPTSHTYKLLIEAHATLEPPDLVGAEAVLDSITARGGRIESSHHAALIHAKGCVLHDVDAAIAHFRSLPPRSLDASLYQALLECLVANHRVADTETWVQHMRSNNVTMTPYIANTLIHGWALEKNIQKAEEIYRALANPTRRSNTAREPSTYEAMTRAYLAVEDRVGAKGVVDEMRGRGYPGAVVARVVDLVREMGSANARA